MRIALALFFLPAYSLGQNQPDFSGIFLRTETRFHNQIESAVPRVLDIRQTADEVVVTATQNRETAVIHHTVVAKGKEKPQAKLKGRSLLVSTTSVKQITWPDPLAGVSMPSISTIEEKWELSSDGQQLMVYRNIGGISKYLDIYARQPSLEVATAAAAKARHKDCSTGKSLRGLMKASLTAQNDDKGAELGVVMLQGITRCVTYEASLSGDFFKHLLRIKDPQGLRFLKSGRPVTAYTGDLVLEVSPYPYNCRGEAGSWRQTGTPPPEASLDLRFMVRWMSNEGANDLGEVQSEFRYEPWLEQSPPRAFYRMRIPAQDIPLANDLEVTIFSKTGEELACVKGHI